MATVTITIATPAIVTHIAHAIPEGNMVAFTTTEALPTGIVATTAYYIHVIDVDSYNIATTRANALGGTYIATSGTQSGTHTGQELTGVVDEENLSIQDGAQVVTLSNVPLAATVILTNLISGSEVSVYLGTDPATTILLASTESSGTNFTFTHYVGGLTGFITIIKPGYKWISFQVTFTTEDVSILIFPIADLGYNNPI